MRAEVRFKFIGKHFNVLNAEFGIVGVRRVDDAQPNIADRYAVYGKNRNSLAGQTLDWLELEKAHAISHNREV